MYLLSHLMMSHLLKQWLLYFIFASLLLSLTTGHSRLISVTDCRGRRAVKVMGLLRLLMIDLLWHCREIGVFFFRHYIRKRHYINFLVINHIILYHIVLNEPISFLYRITIRVFLCIVSLKHIITPLLKYFSILWRATTITIADILWRLLLI